MALGATGSVGQPDEVRNTSLIGPLVLAATILGACAAPAAQDTSWVTASSVPEARATATVPPPPAGELLREAVMYRSPTCDCCHEYADRLREVGYTVETVNDDAMTALKERHGVPRDLWSCHTSLIGGYVVEGHVPAEAIEDLLAGQPDVEGIALPGMPAGSPGMGGVKEAPFEILAFRDGVSTPFGSY